MKKPLIGITMGDPCGIGPEIIVKSISSPELENRADFLIIGSKQVLLKAAETSNLSLEFELNQNKPNMPGLEFKLKPVLLNTNLPNFNTTNTQAHISVAKLFLLQIDNFSADECTLRKPTLEGGRASIEYVFTGIDLALNGTINGLVTAPINKEAVKAGGFDYPGHTELLKERTNSEKVVMLMVGDKLRVAFVTSHVSLKKVPELINIDNIFSTIMITAVALKKYFQFNNPRIAVCGLNPHSGEAGRFGTEEMDFVIPAIEKAKDEGINCIGPVPPDVVFFKARKGEYDAVIALYHDQGAIPLKLLAFESGVNITLGIPIIRTSPDHGTAYDIAWSNNANPGSMIEAVKFAIMMGSKK